MKGLMQDTPLTLQMVLRRAATTHGSKHVATATGVAMDRGLVDDVLLAAWMVLHRHGDKVLAAERPWAYLMSSAQKNVLDEVRAQQLLTNTASIRGRAADRRATSDDLPALG
jgi:DNA-directed RNA polymerase specialized sigma24 family protein